MLVQLRDRKALASLPIVNLRSYLESNGWSEAGPWGKRPAMVFTKEAGPRSWEVLLPLRDTVADYAEAMAESIAALAEVEGRSQLGVFHDISGAGADVIRLRSRNGAADKPLSLRQSAGLFQDAYDMLAAVARSVEKPQPIYRGPASAAVTEYLDKVRPLPGDYQGYALTLHSPVPAEFERQGDFGDEFHAPFPRQATLKLADALTHSTTALDAAVAAGTLEPFRQAVAYGVSANLCDSVAELAKKGSGVEINLSWAGVRPTRDSERNFQFSTHSADILAEVAKSFRSSEPFLNEAVIAYVVGLDREVTEFDGRATLSYVKEGRPLRLLVRFEETAYSTVIRAFEGRIPISLDGDIYRAGNGYELRNPVNLSLVSL